MPQNPPRELVQVGCYLRQDQAEERGLVVLAQERPYWIIEEDGLFGLYVDSHDVEAATAELERFEEERADVLAAAECEAASRAGVPGATPVSLFVFIWMMLFFFGMQRYQGSWWSDLGAADAKAIFRGEPWRVFTALTLHADLGHLLANLVTGLVFAWALLPLLGSGWTWSGLVLSGGVGNFLNALLHRGGDHLSIGASTGVFGGLGLLVGWQVMAALQTRYATRTHTFSTRGIVLPLAAGFALLAYLGVGNEGDRVDILAHGFGMLSGMILGALLAWTHLPERTSALGHKLLALLALAISGLAWVWAISAPR